MSELITCSSCQSEYELSYSFKNEEEVVSQDRCKCALQKEKQILKEAFKILNKREVINEVYKSITN